MDMKKILQVIDVAGKRPVGGSNDMKKFVNIVKENNVQIDLNTQQMSNDDIYTIANPDFERDAETGREEPDEIEVKVKYSSYIDEFEIDKIVRVDTGEDITDKVSKNEQLYWNLSHDVKQREQGRERDYESIQDDVTPEGSAPTEQQMDKTISDLMKDALGTRPDREWGARWMSMSYEEKLKVYNGLVSQLGEGIVDNDLSFKDYFNLLEANKKMKGKDPCWKGYKMVGTKKKGGREVPNCVPGKKGD